MKSTKSNLFLIISTILYYVYKTNGLNIDEIIPNDCGRRSLYDRVNNNVLLKTRVVNGKPAITGQYPWQAQIAVYKSGGHEHHCGGIIISEYYILTAAHCMGTYSQDNMVVYVGKHSLRCFDCDSFAIENYRRHREYKSTSVSKANDIAVVKLKPNRYTGRGIQFNEKVQPICLPPVGTNSSQYENCEISGWGHTQQNSKTFSENLLGGKVPISSDQLCTSYEVYEKRFEPGLMICAADLEKGIDTCQGDSGGPLSCQIKKHHKKTNQQQRNPTFQLFKQRGTSNSNSNSDIIVFPSDLETQTRAKNLRHKRASMIQNCPNDNHKCLRNKIPSCLPKRIFCDGFVHCDDSSDEYPTNSKCHPSTKPRPCYDDEFQCANQRCVDLSTTCDLRNDCGDWSDEKQANCPKEIYKFDCNFLNSHKCDNQLCIDPHSVCDGIDHCGDGSDERYCESETTSQPTEKLSSDNSKPERTSEPITDNPETESGVPNPDKVSAESTLQTANNQNTDSDDDDDTRWYAAGVVAFGSNCGDNIIPGVYTAVSHYINFIRKTITILEKT